MGVVLVGFPKNFLRLFLVDPVPMNALKLLLLSSIPPILSVPINDDSNVKNILSENLATIKSNQNLEIKQNLGNYPNAKLVMPPKTRTGRQSNYPLMIYGGCYPPGGFGWGSQPPSYPPYNPFGNQNRATTNNQGWDYLIEAFCRMDARNCPKR
ncbi:hypothetical protein Fcan01_17385 [Folsomia candida]|uniref:Uncharacterized protein n=1 Tax=Folsomia candida TaxID=158441 RepID=A0A226DTN5_FOLCA|nr:hypothetical protein Fcan01_17385 [Folsomia candida]